MHYIFLFFESSWWSIVFVKDIFNLYVIFIVRLLLVILMDLINDLWGFCS
jgi:hypothetical protein